jgi:hypothetical protein
LEPVVKLNELMNGAVNSSHVGPGDLPWAGDGKAEMRVLQFREDEGLLVAHLRSAAGVVSPLHRHLAPALTYTLAGTWSHRPDVMDYGPGTYEYEPTGSVHRYYGGPATVERITISFGGTERIDDEGQVAGQSTLESIVDHYYRLCESQRLPRPAILR